MLRRILVQLGVAALALATLLGVTSPCSAQIGFGRGAGVGIGFGGFSPAGWGGYPMMGFGSGIGISRGLPGGPNYSGGYYTGGYNSPSYYSYTPTYYGNAPLHTYNNYNGGYYAVRPHLGDSDVVLDVRVPADAKVWVNGEATTQTGAERRYLTNDLTPGRSYVYSIKARWTEDGKPIEYERKVKVHGGQERVVNFNVPR
jgi:uncharacterized protein (TIGR03000 family)